MRFLFTSTRLGLLWIACQAGLGFTATKTMVIGVEAIDYLPYYVGVEGKGEDYKGFSRELLDMFGKENGITFTYKPLPVKRLFHELLVDKTIDFKYPDNTNWGTDWSDWKQGKSITYSNPDICSESGAMVLPDSSDMALDQFNKIAVILGFTPQAFVAKLKEGKLFKEDAASIESLLKMAITKRVQGAYIAYDVGNYTLKDVLKTPGALVKSNKLPYDVQNFSLSSVKHPDLVEKYNQFLGKQADAIKELKIKHSIDPNSCERTK